MENGTHTLQRVRLNRSHHALRFLVMMLPALTQMIVPLDKPVELVVLPCARQDSLAPSVPPADVEVGQALQLVLPSSAHLPLRLQMLKLPIVKFPLIVEPLVHPPAIQDSLVLFHLPATLELRGQQQELVLPIPPLRAHLPLWLQMLMLPLVKFPQIVEPLVRPPAIQDSLVLFHLLATLELHGQQQELVQMVVPLLARLPLWLQMLMLPLVKFPQIVEPLVHPPVIQDSLVLFHLPATLELHGQQQEPVLATPPPRARLPLWLQMLMLPLVRFPQIVEPLVHPLATQDSLALFHLLATLELRGQQQELV